jgi:hypothetical protein
MLFWSLLVLGAVVVLGLLGFLGYLTVYSATLLDE